MENVGKDGDRLTEEKQTPGGRSDRDECDKMKKYILCKCGTLVLDTLVGYWNHRMDTSCKLLVDAKPGASKKEEVGPGEERKMIVTTGKSVTR